MVDFSLTLSKSGLIINFLHFLFVFYASNRQSFIWLLQKLWFLSKIDNLSRGVSSRRLGGLNRATRRLSLRWLWTWKNICYDFVTNICLLHFSQIVLPDCSSQRIGGIVNALMGHIHLLSHRLANSILHPRINDGPYCPLEEKGRSEK